MRRLFRWAFRLIALAILVLAGFVAWGIFWPKPSDAPFIKCPSHTPHPCIAASGRVVLRTMSHGRPHLLLFSRHSVSFPGITVVEFVDLKKMPTGTGFGAWVSVYGTPLIGSHHEKDIHVQGFATSTVVARCAWTNEFGRNQCPEHRRH